MTYPKTVSELFPSRWLSCADLNGRSVVVTIEAVQFDLFPAHPRTTEKTTKAFIDFGRSKNLILNSTQANAIADIVGSEKFTDWTGRKITLMPATSHNGKPTIKIGPPPHIKEEEQENG